MGASPVSSAPPDAVWFRAVDAANGKILFQQKLSSGIIGQPITYLGPDGRQYVAIPSGVGGAASVQAARVGYPARGSILYIFSLDGKGVQDGRVGGS